LKSAGVMEKVRVTSIRSSALTALLASGATKEEADRWSRHSSSADTIRRFYDRNINDEARKKLASFK
jgi:hypothetical protein